MAINPNNARTAQHACFACATGNGKGIALTSLNWVEPKSCVLIFDPYGEYNKKFGKRPVNQYKTRRWFAKAFAAAWRSGKPFVLSYFPQVAATKAARQKELEWFGQLAWAAADGNRVLYAIIEEYGKCVDTNAQDDSIIGEIATGGRKFGLRLGTVFQRSAEVPKTIWGNSPIKIIGAQEYTADVKRIQDQLGCTQNEVAELGRLNQLFSLHKPELNDKVKTKVHYLVARGLHDFEKLAAIVEPNRKMIKDWTQPQKDAHKASQFKVINP